MQAQVKRQEKTEANTKSMNNAWATRTKLGAKGKRKTVKSDEAKNTVIV